MGLFHKRLQTEINNIPVVGGDTYTRMTLTSDVTSSTTVASYIDEWRINPFTYGHYRLRAKLIIANEGAGSASGIKIASGADAGLVYASFTVDGSGYRSNDSALYVGVTGVVDMINSISIASGISAEFAVDGVMSALTPDSYYGNDFRLSLRSDTEVVKLKSGSWIEYQLIS